jgi:ATP-dependent protease ClpP protease subunit
MAWSADAALIDDWMAVAGDGVGWEVACYDVDDDGSCMFDLRLFGRITPETVTKVEKALAHRQPKQRVVVSLASQGGDIDAAMRLGRIFREAHAHTEVRQGATCISACALAYAGGIVRHAFDEGAGGAKTSKIGIHRPAIAAVPQQTDMNALKRAMDEAVHRMREYATEMNVSERLIDDMLVIPPESIRWLSDSERDAYGLGYIDPVFAEAVVVDGAKKYGISPAEYRSRDARARAECDVITYDEAFGFLDGERSKCATEILSGER